MPMAYTPSERHAAVSAPPRPLVLCRPLQQELVESGPGCLDAVWRRVVGRGVPTRLQLYHVHLHLSRAHKRIRILANVLLVSLCSTSSSSGSGGRPLIALVSLEHYVGQLLGQHHRALIAHPRLTMQRHSQRQTGRRAEWHGHLRHQAACGCGLVVCWWCGWRRREGLEVFGETPQPRPDDTLMADGRPDDLSAPGEAVQKRQVQQI
mmetsp:Transcript_28176/g.81150  ORF Transcript_28176/g.81150 Transcript_28176/m.81150 type:complete len:207 (-) Transcript_28176:234-854(-)